MKRLRDLLGPEISNAPGVEGVEIKGLSCDSRTVGAGDLFAAMPGTQVDGARFIPQAISAGASAILCATDAVVPDAADVTILRAGDPRLALARISARFFARQPQTTLAVTGTSGKSSCADFVRQILRHCGRSAASIGTVGVVKPDGQTYGSLTTPDPITLHRLLAELTDEGVTHLAFEASSHGLDQRRLDGVAVTAAGFTNLGRDHLDYHPTVDDYFAAKLRLFREVLPEGAPAVINIDDARGPAVAEAARKAGRAVVTVGRHAADIQIADAVPDGFGQRVSLRMMGQTHHVTLPLIGAYQVDNAALAAGLCIAAGERPETCFQAFETLVGVAGRLEPVGAVRGATIIVDYAHKPEALQAALAALRPFATGRLICVFGCGGDRDTGKRPVMGEIAAEGADVVIVTDDNPRSEDPAEIRAAIMAAAPGARDIGDRAEAIHAAIDMARAGDVIVIAGKGHETGQIVGGTTIPFSDHAVARAAIDANEGCGE